MYHQILTVPRGAGRTLEVALTEAARDAHDLTFTLDGQEITFRGYLPDLFAMFRDGHSMLSDFLGVSGESRLSASPPPARPRCNGDILGQCFADVQEGL